MVLSVNFSKKKCVPCEGIGKAMANQQVADFLRSTPQWNLGKNQKSIERKIIFKNFVEVVGVINRIKDIAELQGHHPDLHLTGYKNLKVVLYTHALGGLTENDFIMAAKINELNLPLKASLS